METREKIKTSWRFRIANWILGGTLPDVYMTVEPIEFDI